MLSGSSATKLTTVGLVLAFFAVVTPILLDWYKSRAILELHVNAMTTIVSRTPGLEKLEIKYDGKKVSSISKFTFNLINKANKPLIKNDIVKPPTINFSNNSQLLDVQVDRKIPKDLIASAESDYKNNSISISFPLLNQGDQVVFSALLSGNDISYETSCRIYGVKEMIVVDKIAGSKDKLAWEFYVVSILFVLIPMGFLPVITEYKGAKLTLAKINEDKDRLLGFGNKDEYIDYIKNIPFYYPYKEETINKIGSILADTKEQSSRQITTAIMNQVNHVIRINKIALYVIPLLTALSGGYVFSKIAKLMLI